MTRITTDIDVAIRLARPWRRSGRAALYEGPTASADPWSVVRTAF
ncbi:hypothetical protein ABZ281_48555 [Streptomyces sp. NPDC006265]